MSDGVAPRTPAAARARHSQWRRWLKSGAAGLLRRLGAWRNAGHVYQLVADAAMQNLRTVEHDGVRLSFVVANHVNAWRVASFSAKEPETLAWIDGFAPGEVLWDVGANVGLYSCYAARRRNCRVFAFEPSVFNLEILARNVWINELSELVTIVPVPLNESRAESTLNMTTTQWGGAMSTFGHDWTHDGTRMSKVFGFRTVGLSMDQALSGLGIAQPDHVKMDVDGLEHLILKGGAGVLGRVKSVLVEINEDFAVQARESAGYLQAAGLVLHARLHAEIFDSGVFRNCYNQIWRRA